MSVCLEMVKKMQAFPCSICENGGHVASKCPELWHPERTGGGGGGHSHDDDDDDEKVTFSLYDMVLLLPNILNLSYIYSA